MFALLAATTAKPHASLLSYIPLLAVIGVWYFYIRPKNKKAKEQRANSRNFEVGDEIQTIGGLIGRVTAIDGDLVSVSAGGNTLEFHRRAIGGRYERPVAPDATEEPQEQ